MRKLRIMNTINNLVYDTEYDGGWTLTGATLSAPEQRTNYITVHGSDGDVDLSTAATDGEPSYKNRTLQVTLENSNGSRKERDATIEHMVNLLDGYSYRIVLPDDSTRYVTGRVHIAPQYNDTAHAAVNVTAYVEPWRYAISTVVMDLQAEATAQTEALRNRGRRRATPTLTGYATGGGSFALFLSAGTWTGRIADSSTILKPMELAMGYMEVKTLAYSGSGQLVIRYGEAIL